MGRNLEKYKSSYIDEPGEYEVTIAEAKDDYTRSSKECVFVKFETDDNRTIACSYVEAVYFKLRKLAKDAGLTESQRKNFDPAMLVGKQLRIHVIESNGRMNVNDTSAIVDAYDAPATPVGSKNTDFDDLPF